MLEHKEQTVQCTKVTFIYSIHYMNQKKWEQHKDLKLKRSKGSNKTFANLICFLYVRQRKSENTETAKERAAKNND